MKTCERGGKFRARWLLLLVVTLWRVPGALGMDTTLTVESANGASFPNLTDIVVGGASDVIVTVRCVATPAGPVEWSYGGNSSVVTSGLTPFGVSQEDGVLRIYPASLLGEEDQYTCSSGQTHTVSVQFRLASSLFFTNTVPSTINIGTDVTTVCPVPNIPQATMTAVGMDNITYCSVTSERGSFRSRSVTTVDPAQQVPTYQIEPVNITARPASGGSARVAFSCSITPDENLATIQWFFEPMEFGSGMGPSMMVDPGFLTNGTIGVANVTIVGGLADPGTSILVLDGVGNEQEGFYSCVATLSDGRMINSSSGALIYNATANNEDTIILSPPTTLTVQEREAVTIPCVASGTQQPVFMFGGSVLPTGAQSNQYSLDFAAITPESNGSYSCQVGSTTSTFSINVLQPLVFTSNLQLQPEYRVCTGTVSFRLRCNMSQGNPPPGLNIWLRNGVEVGVVGSGNRMELTADRERLIISRIEEGDAGIYHCLSSVDNQPATTIAQSGYLNVYFLRDINIAPTEEITLGLPDTPSTITLNCSVVAHPIPRLEWTMNGQPVVGQQAATGFMETPFSLLTVNTSDLVNGVETFNCTATLDLSGVDESCSFDGSISTSVDVTAYSMVNITGNPQPTGPVLVGETAVFTCQARSIPAPTITWFRLENGMAFGLLDNGDDINIMSQSQPEDSFTSSSILSVRVTGDEDFTEYFCVGDNGFDNSTSERAQLGSMVNITGNPQSTGPVMVGETAVFTCQARSIPSPTITWFRFQSGMEVELMDNGDDINIASQPEDNFTTNSILSVMVTGDEDFTEYFCVGDNGFDNSTSDNATLGSMVSITGNPQPTGPVMVGETAVFTCQARSIPAPNITWFRFQNGTNVRLMDNDGDDINITSQLEANFTTRSTLSVMVTGDEDFTEYFCVGDNGFDNSTSDNATLGSMVTITENPRSTDPLLVGETANFTCQARSIPSSTITWFQFQNGMESELVDSRDNITITSQPEDSFTTRSTLSVMVTGDEDFTEYFCVGDNGFDNSTSDNATLVRAVAPSFLEEPSNVTATNCNFISLNCTATGVPLPTIVWEDGEGGNITDDEVYNITTVVAENVVSVLEFGVLDGVNGSQFRCVAENRAGRTESELATIIIGGVPLPPNPMVDSITSRGALVSWLPPFSILPLIQYNITWVCVDDGEENSATIGADMTQLLLTSLQPNQMYRVTVVAVNCMGASLPSDPVVFMTSEDVPEAPPTNITSSSTQLNEIDISWDPPRLELQNGLITHYNVCYLAEGGAQTEQCVNVSSSLTSTTLTMGISPGTTYLIRVAAATAVGLGPFSGNHQQMTLSDPPSIPPPPPPPTGVPVTTTTISITLPTITNLQEFSHFWVIALITDASIDTTQQPTELFMDNSSFTTYSSSVSPGTPYIVAEISSTNYPTTFVLGADDNSTNDFPELYRNGPLQPNTEYTAFVWGFVPSVPNGIPVSKRQVSSLPRQYSAFSSSEYHSPVRTAAVATGLSGGAIAGIVIGIVVFVILLVGAVVLIFVLWGRRHLEEKIGPPPSRQGSMRLREQRQVVLTNLRNRKAESELQDLNPDDVRLPISVEKFPQYMRSMHANSDHLFSEEYQIVSIKSPNLPHVQCSLPYNVNKNRYANINCYDDSRVHLAQIPGVEGSDYINANFIDGYQKKNAFIATQGPLPNTTPDFWRMVWEYRCCCIIMLTNVVEKSRAKCHQYWPEAGSVSFGDLTVTILEVQELAYYTIRTFRMHKGNERFEVKQFHYTAWPDFGVPDHPNPVIAFIRRINNFKRTLDGPDIMHCSAGVGRTGTLITIQSMVQMMYEEGKIDIFNFVLATRRQRNYMVQTEHQYIFIHDALLEMINVGETEIPIHNLRRRVKELQAQNPDSELSPIEEEYIHLKEIDSIDNSQFESARMAVNVTKNRFQEILPYDSYRVRLLLHPGVVGSDYMNASYVDGYQQRHQYILTQGPMKHTVDDFWRMVWEHRASTIMMLCQLEEKGKEQSARYWPMDKLRQHGDLFVELTQQQDFVTYTTREFSITNTKINESRMVRHFQYIDWPEDHCPTNAAAIIDLIGVLQKAQRQLGGGPIIIHDSTSVGRAGTFCVLSSVLEQLKVEGIVDIFFTIHSLRQQQPGIVSTMEQYKFCYQAVLEFLDSFDHYANFD